VPSPTSVPLEAGSLATAEGPHDVTQHSRLSFACGRYVKVSVKHGAFDPPMLK
jgi:hypothetical protein